MEILATSLERKGGLFCGKAARMPESLNPVRGASEVSGDDSLKQAWLYVRPSGRYSCYSLILLSAKERFKNFPESYKPHCS